MDFRQTLGRYYVLAKPGIIYANVLTALAGYLFASHFAIHLATLLGLLTGLALVIGGACAYNNVLDRRIDARMKRTQKRGLVSGNIAVSSALFYASVLTAAGLALLWLSQNSVTVLLAAVALLDYVVLYGLSKRRSVHGTLVGCISGAIPLVAGYTAVTAQVDRAAWLLFGLMVAWQMAHFYGIALYRRNDYAAANIPVMPVVYGAAVTKLQTVGYIGLFMGVTALLASLGYIGFSAGLLLIVIAGVWLYRAIKNYGLPAEVWGKQVFIVSLSVMLGMSVVLAFGPLVP